MPAVMAAVRDGSEAAARELVTRRQAGLFEFELFSSAFRAALLGELRAFVAWCAERAVTPTRPNSMNEHGVMMSEFGLDDALRTLLIEVIRPLARHLFSEHAGETLDHHHSFVVDYSEDGDTSLGYHVDDSEVTLNACLGIDFDGAEVYFRGERCSMHRQSPDTAAEAWDWFPRPGSAILHAGAHRHGVHPLESGRRLNLIVWGRSSAYRSRVTAPHEGPANWCGSCRVD